MERRPRPLVLLLLACAVLALTACQPAAAPKPRAANGQLDLSGWDFAARGSASLDGQWELYWQKLLTPADLAAGAPPPDALAPVPGGWNGLRVGNTTLGADGYGTFRLRVKLGPHPDEMALYVRYMSSEYKLWVDGQLLAQNGQVGTTAATSVPLEQPTIVYFVPRGDTVDLVAQVANFSHRRGGVWNPVVLGTATQVTRDRLLGLGVATAQGGAIALFALYHLGVFVLRRRDRSALYFGLFCLIIAVRTLIVDEMPLARIGAGLPWEAQLRTEYLTDYLALTTLTAFLGALFPGEVARLGQRIVYAVTGLLCLFTLVVPVKLSSEVILPYEAFAALAVLWLVVGVARAVVRRREGARLMLVGSGAFLVLMVVSMLGYNLVIVGADLLPLGLIAMLVAQSVVLARRFAAAFYRQEALAIANEQLSVELREQLEEVRLSRERIVRADERARREIAELLHGRVQPTLLAATNELADLRSATGDPGAAAALDDVVARLERVREEEVRRVSHLLHPSVIRVGLVPALYFLTEQLGGRLRIDIRATPAVEVLDDPIDNQISDDLRLSVYRVVEEALGNVLRHAEATRVEVALDVVERDGASSLRLTVRDDGRGFDPAAMQGGLGVQAIADRVAQLGGAWSLESAPGAGTTVAAEWPLAKTDAALAVSLA